MTAQADTSPQAGAPPAATGRPAASPGRRRTVALAVILSLSIGGMVLVSALGVLLVMGITGERTAFSLYSRLSDLAGLLIEARVRAYLDEVPEQVDFIADLVHLGEFDPDDATRLESVLIGAVASTPQISALLFWDTELQLTAVARREGEIVVLRQRMEQPWMRDALNEASARTEPHWAEVIYVEELRTAALNVREPVFDPSGAFRGMLMAIIPLEALSLLMADLTGLISPSQESFILYGQNHVLAHPNLSEGPFHGLSPDAPLPTLFAIGDPIVGAIPRALPTERLSTEFVGTSHVALSDREYLFLFKPLSGYAPEPLLIVQHLPVDEVGQELQDLLHAVVFCLAVLVIAVLGSVVLSRLIARPIRRLSMQAMRIGSLEFDRIEPLPGSPVSELNNQSQAFNRMLAGLTWLETYVPRSLVKRLLSKGRGESVHSVERDLTVLFTDIVGFTPLAETLSAADTADLLNSHFALLGACVEAEEGTIDKFIGDSLMAFWGAPEKQRDHAVRACRAALAMAHAMAEENCRRAKAGLRPLGLRIGIHTGTMVVGNIGAPGRMNYTIVGDPVNTGQRLEQLGKELRPEGSRLVTILVSAATAAQLPRDLPVAPLGEHLLRGRHEPIAVFGLLPPPNSADADDTIAGRDDH